MSQTPGDARRVRRAGVVSRLYNDAWAPGHLDLALELLDPEVVWTAIEEAPDAGTYRGHDGVRAYMQEWLADFDLHSVSIEESIEIGDRLVCVQRGRGTGRVSGVTTELHFACVYTFGEDERIAELNEYATREKAVAAAAESAAD